MRECEKLESSRNFQEISKFSLENIRKGKLDINFVKFEEGARKVAGWIGKTYGKKAKLAE